MRVAAIVLAVPLALGGCALPWVKPAPAPTVEFAEPATIITAPAEPVQATAPVTPAPADVWSRLAAQFSWRGAEHAIVRDEIERFARRPRGYTRTSATAEPFLWYIAEQLEQRHLPAELALLPMIESRYRSGALSPYGAAGLWQFMPATGRTFGLRQTRYFDARFDVIASTRAALDFLEQLHRDFDDDWLLAIAAYNCGPATVRRALARRNARDFWAIADMLPTETRVHVPRLLAAVAIAAQPEDYGITLHPIANEAYFEAVDLGGPLDLEYILALDDELRATFATLNPAFRRGVTDPAGPHRVLVPIRHADEVIAAVANAPPERRLPTRTYVVRRGDTLSGIAARFDTPINGIRRRNGLTGNLIKPGRELIIPGSDAFDPPTGIAATDIRHTVAAGDSLWSIGQRYGYTAREVARVNKLRPDAVLQPGQVLSVEARTSTATYDVAPGDSLWEIARRFNVSVDELRRWNGLSRRQPLQPGQALNVSRPLKAAARHL